MEPRETERQRYASSPHDWCWQVLGVSPHASLDEVTRHYRQALRMCQPDRLAGLAPELVALAERRTEELNAAFSQAKCSLHSRAAQ